MLSLPSLPPNDLHKLWYTRYSSGNGFDDGSNIGENASASGYIKSGGVYSSRRHQHGSNGEILWTGHVRNMSSNRHGEDFDATCENLPINGSTTSGRSQSMSYYSAGNRVISGGSIVGSSIFGSDGAELISVPSLAAQGSDEEEEEEEEENGGENDIRLRHTTTTGLGPVEGKVCKCSLDCDEVDYRHFLQSVQTFGYGFLRPPGIERTIAAAHEQLEESDEGSYETNELEFSGGENSVDSGIEDQDIIQEQDGEIEEQGEEGQEQMPTTTNGLNNGRENPQDDHDDDDDGNNNQVDLDDLIAEGDDFNGSFYDTSESEHSFVENLSDDRQQQQQEINAQNNLQGFAYQVERSSEGPQTPQSQQSQQAAQQPPMISRLSTTNGPANNYTLLNTNLSLSISESDVSLEQSVLQYVSRGGTRSVSLDQPSSPAVAMQQQEREESSLGDFVTEVSMSDDMSFDDD